MNKLFIFPLLLCSTMVCAMQDQSSEWKWVHIEKNGRRITFSFNALRDAKAKHGIMRRERLTSKDIDALLKQEIPQKYNDCNIQWVAKQHIASDEEDSEDQAYFPDNIIGISDCLDEEGNPDCTII